MGLTIHYKLKAESETEAKKLVYQLHQAAHDLPFKEVGEVVDLSGDECNLDLRDKDDPLRWLICQSSSHLQLKTQVLGRGQSESVYLTIPAHRIIAFEAWPGEGCETSNFGFCLYPATVEHRGKKIRTKLSGWRWSSFCKTQYASDPNCGGIKNFLRCHFTVIALLDKAKLLGCLDDVRDEGKFWENRDVEALVKEIGNWNQFIAAFGGKLKDVLGAGIEMPIAEFPNFEHLEQAGQSKLPPETEQLAKLIKQVSLQH